MNNTPKSKREKGCFAPGYYSKFKCIADKCRHSCCVDWEICIDEITYSKYKQLGDISPTVKECEDGACFDLKSDGRCPHLNDSGLCNIILTHGEELLSDICKNHPRFFNEVGLGRCEIGLGIVCEEACRLIIEDDTRFSLSQTAEPTAFEPDGCDIEFDALALRDRVIYAVESSEGGYEEKLTALKAEFGIPELYEPEEWLERYLSLEILDEDWKRDLESMRGRSAFKSRDASGKYGKYYERLLKYFVYRHVSMANSSDNFSARLGFAMLSVDMIAWMLEAWARQRKCSSDEQIFEGLIDFARRYSAEIEYSEDNTDELIFAFECGIYRIN